jgi:hypothetical protein
MWQGWGKRRGACSCLVGKPDRERERQPGQSGYENDIKMDLHELRRGMDLIDLAQVCQAVMKKVMNIRV